MTTALRYLLEAFNLIQFFTVDTDVHADTICVVGHQFVFSALICQRLQRSYLGDPLGRLGPPGPARPSMSSAKRTLVIALPPMLTVPL